MIGFSGAGVQQHLDWVRGVERERLVKGWYWNKEQQNRIAQQKLAQRNSGLPPFGSQGIQLAGRREWKLLILVCPVEGCKTPPVPTFQYKICWCPVHNKVMVDKRRVPVAALRRPFSLAL